MSRVIRFVIREILELFQGDDAIVNAVQLLVSALVGICGFYFLRWGSDEGALALAVAERGLKEQVVLWMALYGAFGFFWGMKVGTDLDSDIKRLVVWLRRRKHV